MDHLSIYENGIVNPYKNKGELSKSFLCPPAQTGGVKKACISTRTVILMVITMVSTISYVLHLHLSKESVAISKSLLRGSKFKDSTKRNIIELDKIVTAEDNNSIKEIEKIVEDTKTIAAVKPEYVPQRKTISILLNALNQSLTSSKVTEINNYNYKLLLKASNNLKEPVVVRNLFINSHAINNWNDTNYLKRKPGILNSHQSNFL
jgi:hypothetical protein